MDDDSKKTLLYGGAGGGLITGITLIVILANIYNLGPEDQVVYTSGREKVTVNGPKTTVLNPFKSKEERQAVRLWETQYAVVKDTKKNILRNEIGPKLLWLGGWDKVEYKRDKILLQLRQYIRLVNTLTGIERVVEGPQALVPEPLETAPVGVEDSIVVSPDLAILVRNRTRGIEYLITDEGVFSPGPYEEIVSVQQAVVVSPREYAVLRDTRTNVITHVPGPTQIKVQPRDEIVDILPKLVLEADQFIRLVSRITGVERVETGPVTLVPDPQETYRFGVEQAVRITVERTALVENATGFLRHVNTPGIFFPGPYERIVSVNMATLLGPQEFAVIEDNITAMLSHVPGPALLHLAEHQILREVRSKIVLEQDEYIRMTHQLTGVQRVMRGPQLFIPEPNENPHFAVFCSTGLNGTAEDGQQVCCEARCGTCGADNCASLPGGAAGCCVEDIVDAGVLCAQSSDSGCIIRDPLSQEPDGVTQAFFLDNNSAVLLEIQDPNSAMEKQLNDTKGVYVPAPYTRIIEERNLIRVLTYEAVIVRDAQGAMTIFQGDGNGAGDSFFLPPYTSVMVMSWSSFDGSLAPPGLEVACPSNYYSIRGDVPGDDAYGREASNIVADILACKADCDARSTCLSFEFTFSTGQCNLNKVARPTLPATPSGTAFCTGTVPKVDVDIIDLRARRMFFKYDTQTRDNVRLTLTGTVFWQVTNVGMMVNTTSDPEGDIYSKCRSKMIVEVSAVDFETFVDQLSNITKAAATAAGAEPSILSRGLQVWELELTDYTLIDEETAANQQSRIVQNVENLNQKAQQETSDSIAAKELDSEIALEAKRSELIAVQATNSQISASMVGTAAGLKAVTETSTFIGGLSTSVPDEAQRLDLYQYRETLVRRSQDVANLAASREKVRVFMKPEDFNLAIST